MAMAKKMLIISSLLFLTVDQAECGLVSGMLSSQAQVVSENEIGMPKKLECDVDNGGIVIRGVDSNFSCKYTAHNIDPDETVKVKKSGDTLKVEFKKPRGQKGLGNARVDFELALPRNCTIKINLGNGSVTVQSIDGRIKVAAGNASIKAYELTNDAKFEIGNGNCEISYKNSAENAPKKCKIKGGSLNAIITLPANFCVKNTLEATPFALTVTNEFAKCYKKPRDIIISGGIGAGSVKIIKNNIV